jgi:hypothetical protein
MMRIVAGVFLVALAVLAYAAPRMNAYLAHSEHARGRFVAVCAALFCLASPLLLLAVLAARWIQHQFAAGR